MKPKIYIAGKITGMENEASALFEELEILLKSKGFEVVNPMKLEHNHDKKWSSYMKVCIRALVFCDEVVMLKNWQYSIGAKIEHTVAKTIGMKINYQNEINWN